MFWFKTKLIPWEQVQIKGEDVKSIDILVANTQLLVASDSGHSSVMWLYNFRVNK